MKRIVLLLIALISLVSVAAVACGSEDESSETVPDTAAASPTGAPAADTTQSAATTQQQTESTPAPATTKDQQTTSAATSPATAKVDEQPEVEERSGGVLRRLWSDPPTLDPHLSSDTTSAGVVVEIYSGLVALNTDLQLVPDIADRWEISEDGMTYTFHIRDNARFQNGKPITASDFKWSLERAASPDTASPVADTYLGDIIGANDVLEGKTTDLAGVRVIDDRTLRIEIDAPKAYFLAKLTYPTAYVLDRENVEAGGNWTDAPNGSGPFRLAEYRVGERIVLERNENFYLEPPHLDSVIMNLAGGQSMAMYENDEIDITGVGLFELERVLDPAEPLNKELVIAPPSFTVFYIGFNATEPPFDDQKFRQALTHAVDKDLIANGVLSELVTPAYGVLPPGFPGYNVDLAGLEYDPDLARQLLSESKYADAETRPRIVVTVPGTGGSIGLDMEVVIEMWRQELEVEVEIQQVEWATYLQDLNGNKFQAFGGSGWQADYPDPQDFLDILFHTDSKQNHTSYSNPELDAILEKARTEPDVERRVELYHQAEDLIIQDAPMLPLWYTGEQYILIKGHIEDYRLTPMTIPKLRHVKYSG